MNLVELKQDIKDWGKSLGFQQLGFTTTDLAEDETHLLNWLQQGRHGSMGYMERHGKKRSQPEELVNNTISIISVRMDYMPPSSRHPMQVLNNNKLAYVSRYATGRDYHKLMRKRLQQLANKIEKKIDRFAYRCFVDSAPVLEKALARNAGLGWIGKHSNLIHPKAGSWFFLGEIYTDLPFPADVPFTKQHCGTCTACLDICPTKAIVAPMQVDARRCISYLTIELKGSIPEPLRKMIGNRVYGCDDCQLICPWNKFSRHSEEDDFRVRHGLDSATLIDLFNWTENDFLRKMEGSAIRRIGYQSWLRNVAIGLGNTSRSDEIINTLKSQLDNPSGLVREHVLWALEQHKP